MIPWGGGQLNFPWKVNAKLSFGFRRLVFKQKFIFFVAFDDFGVDNFEFFNEMYDFAVWAIVTIYFGRLYLLGEFGEGDFATLPFLAFFCHQRSRDTSNSNFFSKCKNIFRPLQDSTGYLIEPLGTGLRTDDTPSARCWDGWTRIFRRGNFETKVRIIDCLLLPKGSVSQRTFHSPQPARLDRQLPDELEVRNRRPCVQERAVVRAQPHQEVMWSSYLPEFFATYLSVRNCVPRLNVFRRITSKRQHKMRLFMISPDGEYRQVEYDNFDIAPGSEGSKITALEYSSQDRCVGEDEFRNNFNADKTFFFFFRRRWFVRDSMEFMNGQNFSLKADSACNIFGW